MTLILVAAGLRKKKRSQIFFIIQSILDETKTTDVNELHCVSMLYALSAYTSMLVIYCMGSSFSARSVNQQRRSIIRLGVTTLAKGTRLAFNSDVSV